MEMNINNLFCKFSKLLSVINCNAMGKNENKLCENTFNVDMFEMFTNI